MGLLDRLRTELVDIVEWVDDDRHTLVWKFPRHRDQIKQGAKLIVRPGQQAIFVHQGKLADVFGPGTHELRTGNLPILSTLAGWKFGFDSPIKCDVYFVSTRQVTDLKWGTPNPIMMRDPDFGPVRIRAFGSYALKATDPAALLRELVGTDSEFEAGEVTELMRAMITSTFAEVIGEAEIPVLELASSYRQLSERLRAEVEQRIDDEYGLSIPALFIVNVSLPESVEEALDSRSSMGVIGDMTRYQQYQMGRAIPELADAPAGGTAAEGLGLGMGLAMAGRAMQGGYGMTPAMGMAGGAPVPPPPPGFHVAIDGRTTGPYPPAQVAQMIASSRVSPDVLVWSPALGAWTPASQVPELAALIGAASPPPPPPPPPPSAP